MSDWARERAKDVQRTLRFEQPFEQVENIADALRDARAEERKAIAARLREPDGALVEAVCERAWPAWSDGSQNSKDVIRGETRTTIRALADVLFPSPRPGETTRESE